MNFYAIGASLLGTGVEFIEALTIILAVGSIRGWKNALYGALSAVVVLAALIAIIGAPLINIIHIGWVQGLIGLLMLLFGIRWLRKAILRYAGLKALHDEAQAYEEELERQRGAGSVATGIDKFAFSTTFSGTFLEGLEAVFIVITFGAATHAMSSAIFGAGLAVVLVILAGIMLRSPLAKVPENTMKFVVGVMLTSFGTFWIGEGMHVTWLDSDMSILYIAISLFLFSWLLATAYKVKSPVQVSAHVSEEVHR